MEQRIVQPSKTRSPLLLGIGAHLRILDFEAGRASLLVPSARLSLSLSPMSSSSRAASALDPRRYRLLTVDFGVAMEVIQIYIRIDTYSFRCNDTPNNRNTYAANSFGTSNPIVLDKTRPGYGFFEMVTAVFGGEWCERCIVVSRAKFPFSPCFSTFSFYDIALLFSFYAGLLRYLRIFISLRYFVRCRDIYVSFL